MAIGDKAIAELASILAQAKNGDLRSVSVVSVGNDGRTSIATDGDTLALMGPLDVLLAKLRKHAVAQFEADGG